MKARGKRPSQPNLLHQFRITLLDVKPAIWRRIQVPDCALPVFHKHIQAAMGWDGSHLHMFDIAGVLYSLPSTDDDDLDMDLEDETGVLLSDLLPKSKRKTRWIYEYDFGDSWRHEILFEEHPPTDPNATYPICLEGERSCPPEDCGGAWGYEEFLAALRDPKHKEHKSMLEWIGGSFDPEAFDAVEATRAMRIAK